NLYSIIYKQKHEELPPIRTVRPDTPEDLLLVIDGLLQKDPAARWSSAAAFLSQLGGVEGARAAQASLTAWPAVAAASEVAEPEAPVDQPTLEFVPDAAGSHPSPQSGATTAGVGGGDISGAVQADVVDPPIVDEAFVAAAGAVNAATTAPGVDAPFPGGTGVPPTGVAWTRGYGRRPPPTRKPADQSRRRVLITVGVVLMVIAAGFVATIMGRLGPDQGTEDVAGDVVAGGTTGIPAGGSTGVSTGDDKTGSGVPESPGATLAAVDSASLAALLQGAAGSPARVVRIGGDAQVGTTRSALPIPLQVRVEDEMGRPVPGVPVRFSAVAGGGAVDPVVAVTDANGVASASLTLGREIGEQRVTAMIEPPAEGTAPASAVYSATFFAAALASGPASLVRVGSNIISAEPGSEVAGGIAVRVVDDTGVGVAGVVVEFTVTAGNGVVLPAQVQTDTAGIARASWTLGPEPGVHSVMASVPSAGLVLPIVVTAADRFVARATIVAGGTYSCALDAAGAVACWGANEAGQIGDGTTQRRAAPAAVRSQTRFSTIATGFSHTCGIGADGRAYCWGSNANGQLGDGTRVNRSSPVPVDAATRFTRVTAGLAHTCALTADGLAYCWGSNANGRLGDDSTTDWEWPARVSSNTAFSDITAGWTHTCAVTPAGFAYCWGGNSHGQIGDGSVADRRTPTSVSGGHRFRQLSAGANHTCGVTTDGEVLCWGRNHFGQL
ncbi:MAG TPA: Ig-like domain-containing protein, partial [Longimicrobiales bacterium]|nr:Ig-like domain-containing protein [Longimicrobiales bacterium]